MKTDLEIKGELPFCDDLAQFDDDPKGFGHREL